MHVCNTRFLVLRSWAIGADTVWVLLGQVHTRIRDRLGDLPRLIAHVRWIADGWC